MVFVMMMALVAQPVMDSLQHVALVTTVLIAVLVGCPLVPLW